MGTTSSSPQDTLSYDRGTNDMVPSGRYINNTHQHSTSFRSSKSNLIDDQTALVEMYKNKHANNMSSQQHQQHYGLSDEYAPSNNNKVDINIIPSITRQNSSLYHSYSSLGQSYSHHHNSSKHNLSFKHNNKDNSHINNNNININNNNNLKHTDSTLFNDEALANDLFLHQNPLQLLFYLLRHDIVDVKTIKHLLSNYHIDLSEKDECPIVYNDNDSNNDEYIQYQLEHAKHRVYYHDSALHFLVGRPLEQNTPELLSLVKLFFLKDHPMNITNIVGATPLHRACASGNAPMASELIKYGSDIYNTTDMGLTPLHIACQTGNTDIVILLLQHGAIKQVKQRCIYGMAPIDYVLKDEIYNILKTEYDKTKHSNKQHDEQHQTGKQQQPQQQSTTNGGKQDKNK